MGYGQIAIDGPAGAGKSTIAKLVAKELGFLYVDTGAMYRAITLKALKLNIDLQDENSYRFLEETTLDFNQNVIYLDGVDVSKEIRKAVINKNVSLVSSFKYVREKLVAYQKQIAVNHPVVMDGRDIATVVLPNADLKIFLTAKAETRAQRRYLELPQSEKEKTTIEELIADIKRRDHFDSTRTNSPLVKALDAIEIDTSYDSIEEVCKKIINLYKFKGVH